MIEKICALRGTVVLPPADGARVCRLVTQMTNRVNFDVLRTLGEQSRRRVLSLSARILYSCLDRVSAGRGVYACDMSVLSGVWGESERGELLSLIVNFISRRDCVEDVFSLRVTCSRSLHERRFSPFTRSTVSVLEPDLVEQYVGGDICRYISVSEVKMALDSVHRMSV